MMGADIKKSTELAILSPNYIANRLKDAYPILYSGTMGRNAHEFIIDMKPIKKVSGITEEDVAKRLMDYGFHAPTLSFPALGTLMVEPTESEDFDTVERFSQALLSIREEIREIEEGKADKDNNVLKNSPHTLAVVTSSDWKYPYSREKAAFPLPFVRQKGKFWPAVGRIIGTWGDLNLNTCCPSVHNFI